MKLKLLQRTNIVNELSKTRTLDKETYQEQLNQIYKSLEIKSLNDFNFDKLITEKIYHIRQIKKVSIDYRLRFLDIKYFKNKLPEEANKEIDKLEHDHDTKLGNFKIMAPSILFRLKKADDPLLFVPLGNNYYYLVHSWGNDLHPLRKFLMWPFKNIWNLLITVFVFSWFITELTPMSLFTRTPDSSSYWMLLFFMFKAVASVVIYFGFALGKNFNPAIWNSRYNKA
tara:strand:- start:18327 stop:19007 length:681 start_codon:yes stop_codon:yes gene_type:complete